MLFILGCGIYSAVQQMWTSVAILVVLEILCVAAMFFAVVIETALNGMKDSLVGFVHSENKMFRAGCSARNERNGLPSF